MERKARLVLEYAIKKLDEGACPPEYVSWKAHAEEVIKSGDKEALRIIDNIMDFVIFVEQETETNIKKILVGPNILTPSLTNKGWKFWEPPPLRKKYRKAIKSAVVRWSKTKANQLSSLSGKQGKLPGEDSSDSQIIFRASEMDIVASCRQQLSSELKKILAAALLTG